MKKILATILVCVLVFSMAACSSTTTSKEPAAETPAAAPAAPAESAKDAYPSKSINFIIPYSAGGGTDSLLRLVAAAVEEDLGQQIIVSNITGGGGQVGITQLHGSAADGYNLGAVTNIDHYLTILTGENVAYDLDSFKYIGSVNTSCNVLIVNNDTGLTTLDDFLSYAKDHPGEITVGVSGQIHVLDAGKLSQAAGIKVTTIMHDGAGDSFSACLGGQVDALIIDKKFVAQSEGQNLTVLGSFGADRLPSIADVPTFKEMGYDISTASSRLILAPKDVPDEIITQLAESIKRATEPEDFQQSMKDMSEEYLYLNSEDRTAEVQAEFNAIKALLEADPTLLG